MCSYWITSSGKTKAAAPAACSACRADGCKATGKRQEAGAWAARHRCRGWPCVRNRGPCRVPPACSGAPSTAATGLMKGTAWMRRKRARRRKRRRRGRLRGGVPNRAGLAKRAQTRPLPISFIIALDATSAPNRA